MAASNSVNISQAGLVKFDGTSVFSGVTTTNHNVLLGAASNGITSLALTNGQLAIGNTGNDPTASTLTAGSGVSITNAAGSITIASSASYNYTELIFTIVGSTYTVLSTDVYLGVNTTGGAMTLLFPNAPSTGRYYIIKDKTATAGTNNITLNTPSGTVIFDFTSPSYVMNVPLQSVMIIFNGTYYEVF